MKVLILLLGLISNEVMAVGVSDQELTTKFVSTIQDTRIQKQLQESAEFTECRERALKNKVDPQKAAEEAAVCIQTKLKDPNKVTELADNLKLVEFGLTPSKNIRDVSKYIADKMYKSLTGVDRNDPVDKYLEATKFKNMKQVDQADFFALYKSQLAKNALFQVSAYCFNDFRMEVSAPLKDIETTFMDHWGTAIKDDTINSVVVNASGRPVYLLDTSKTDSKSIYVELEKTITQSFTPDQISKFHYRCTKSINELCTGKATQSKACTLKLSLQNIRKAFTDGEKAWAEYSKSGSKNVLSEIGKYEIYSSTNGKKEDSIDSITTMASSDFLQGVKDDKQLDECISNPELSKCEEYLTDGKSTEDALANSSINLGFRTEIERAKVRSLADKKDEKGLKDYLEANGYLDIVARMDPNSKNPIKISEIAEEVGQIYKSRMAETIAATQTRLGSRQENETAEMKKKAITKNATEFKEEKVRLAQVVLFNNIITSQLSLTRDLGNGKTESAGRNTSGLDKEVAQLSTLSINTEVFKGFKGSDKDRSTASSNNGNSNISNINFVNEYIGEPKTKPKSP